MDDQTLILVLVGLYILAMMIVGAWAGRHVKDGADFIVAGRQLPLWLNTAALIATWYGGITCLGASGNGYSTGLSGVVMDPFGASICLLLAGAFYVRMLRRMKLLTIADVFKRRFGTVTELFACLCMIPAYLGWIGAQLGAFGTILSKLTEYTITREWAVVIGTVIVLAYTISGGMWAVSVTDFFQILVVVIGMFWLFFVVLAASGGWEKVVSEIPVGRWSILPAEEDRHFLGWLNYFELWLVLSIGNIPAQDLYQRAMASRSEKVAQYSCYIGGVSYFIIGMIPVFIGMMGALLIPKLDDPQDIVLVLAHKFLSPIPMAIFVGALISAVMSSADSALLAPSSIVGENVSRWIKPDLSLKQLLWTSRAATVAFAMVAMIFALKYPSVYDLLAETWTIMLVGLWVPLTCALWWKMANTPGAIASFVAGVTVWLALISAEAYIPGFPDIAAGVSGTAASLIAMIVVSLLTQKSHPPRPLTDIDDKVMEFKGRLGVLPPLSQQ